MILYSMETAEVDDPERTLGNLGAAPEGQDALRGEMEQELRALGLDGMDDGDYAWEAGVAAAHVEAFRKGEGKRWTATDGAWVLHLIRV